MPVSSAHETTTTPPLATSPASPIGLNAKFDIPVELQLVGGPTEGIKARIYRVSAGLVELSSPVYIPHNQKLEILCERRRIESRVAYCRREARGTYDLAVRIGADAYIRTETRIPADLATRLHILGSPGSVLVRIVDLSPSGLGMEVPMPLAVGTRVGVVLGYSTALGEIRHCSGRESTYRAGMRLEKLIRRNDPYAPTWTDQNSDSGNTAALAQFERSLEENQLRAETTLLSIAVPVAEDTNNL